MWWGELREIPVSGSQGMDLALQNNLTCYLIAASVLKPSTGGFVLNLKPPLDVFVSCNYWPEQS